MCGITGEHLALLGGFLFLWIISPGVPPWVTTPSDLLSPPHGLRGRRVSDSLVAIKQHLDVERVVRGTADAPLLFPPPAPEPSASE